jgi:IS5 family transposase
MYNFENNHPEFVGFSKPFGGQLDFRNRWVQLADLIPWDDMEKRYKNNFSVTKGRKSKSVRLALGALLIKEKLKITDEETAEQVKENIYMQYFLGFREFSKKAPFEASMMVHFRKRLGPEAINKLNETIAVAYSKHIEKHDNNDKCPPGDNRGKLVIDATAVPQDIKHPSDVTLLNDARLKSEQLIDSIYGKLPDSKKPRTYRRQARRDYLRFIKRKKKSRMFIRRGLRQQLGFVRRNLLTIKKMIDFFDELPMDDQEVADWGLVREIYAQQRHLYSENTHSVSGKILSFSQPHVRAIARGKARGNFEFGSKMSIGVNEHGMVFIDRLQWEPYNECEDLEKQCESYKARFGRYPESIHADKIYWTRVNRQYCAERNIRLSAVPVGRPLEPTEANLPAIKALKKQLKRDSSDRQIVEGKFGTGKRRYSWDKVHEKLPVTSQVTINIIGLLLNLEKILRDLFLADIFYRIKRSYLGTKSVVGLIYGRLGRFLAQSLAPNPSY